MELGRVNPAHLRAMRTAGTVIVLVTAFGWYSGCSAERGRGRGEITRGEAAAVDVAGDGTAVRSRLAGVRNLDRFPGLTADHLDRLERDGFFIAPTKAAALFQLYERNERLELPSYVTPELALEVLLAVTAAVARDVEANFAAPLLDEVLHSLLRRGLDLRRYSLGDSREALDALDRTLAVFAVAERLLSAEGARPAAPPEPPPEGDEEDEAHPQLGRVPVLVPLAETPLPELPPNVAGMYLEAVARIRAADGAYATAALRREVDFRRFAALERAEPGRGRALARALLWLELAAPASGGDPSDDAVGAIVVRLLTDPAEGEVVGEAWRRVARLLAWTGRIRLGRDPFDHAAAFRAALGDAPLPRSAGASLRAILSSPAAPARGTLGLLPGRIAAQRCGGCDETLAWAGVAAAPPSVVAGLPPEVSAARAGGGASALRESLERSRALWTRLVLSAPPVLPGRGASGECVPERAGVVRGAVAPAEAWFAAIASGAGALRRDLLALGVLPEREIEAATTPAEAAAGRIGDLVAAAELFAGVLADIARTDAEGMPWSERQTGAVARVGGWAESILADAIQAEAVVAGDPRRVFRVAEKTVSGIGGVDAIYVVVETPDGPVLARGATYAVYENLTWSFAPEALSDTSWRDWLGSAEAPPRPEWARDFVAEPVPAPPLPAEGGTRRCLGPDSGGDMEI